MKKECGLLITLSVGIGLVLTAGVVLALFLTVGSDAQRTRAIEKEYLAMCQEYVNKALPACDNNPEDFQFEIHPARNSFGFYCIVTDTSKTKMSIERQDQEYRDRALQLALLGLDAHSPYQHSDSEELVGKYATKLMSIQYEGANFGIVFRYADGTYSSTGYMNGVPYEADSILDGRGVL